MNESRWKPGRLLITLYNPRKGGEESRQTDPAPDQAKEKHSRRGGSAQKKNHLQIQVWSDQLTAEPIEIMYRWGQGVEKGKAPPDTQQIEPTPNCSLKMALLLPLRLYTRGAFDSVSWLWIALRMCVKVSTALNFNYGKKKIKVSIVGLFVCLFKQNQNTLILHQNTFFLFHWINWIFAQPEVRSSQSLDFLQWILQPQALPPCFLTSSPTSLPTPVNTAPL